MQASVVVIDPAHDQQVLGAAAMVAGIDACNVQWHRTQKSNTCEAQGQVCLSDMIHGTGRGLYSGTVVAVLSSMAALMHMYNLLQQALVGFSCTI
jgi:hypothetical protein